MFETSHHLSGSPSSSHPHSDSRSPSRLPFFRTHIDAFRSPYESPSRRDSSSRQHSSGAGDMSPHRRSSTASSVSSSSGSMPHFDSSPRALPVSFQDHSSDSHHHHYSSPASSYGHLNTPYLTIRKASSGSLSVSSRDNSLSAFTDPLNHPPWHSQCATASSEIHSPKTRPIERHDFHDDHEEAIFPSDSPPHRHHQIPTCDPESCRHHHHRRSSLSSTVSITCSDEGTTTPPLDSLEIEAAIVMEPMAPSMLVPLVDRSDEMSDLLHHSSNQHWVRLVINALGKDVYEQECLPLWTRTGREHVSDRVWLKRSHDLLTRKWDDRLWDEFCGMVGWDQGEDICLELEGRRSRRLSGASENMAAIKEEEEERP